MTYWLILFQVDPIPLGAPGAIKLMVKRENYEIASQDMNATITVPGKGRFLIQEKFLPFSIEEGTVILVAKVKRVPSEGRDFLK